MPTVSTATAWWMQRCSALAASGNYGGHRSSRQADLVDRYDYDGDGNFNEPDGYIDHFQIVHAGGDQADGDPSRARTPSGPTAGTPTSRPARPAPAWLNRLGGTQIGTTGLGSATTRSSRRTAAVASSPTSTATTSVCPTTTTPARRQRPAWWTLMSPELAASAKDDERHRHPPGDSAPGTSCSSAGSTTRSRCAGDRTHLSSSARTSTTRRRPRRCCVVLPEEGGHHERSARPAPGTQVLLERCGDDLEHHACRAPFTLPAGVDRVSASGRGTTSRPTGTTPTSR